MDEVAGSTEVRRSTRDYGELRRKLERWLADRAGQGVDVVDLVVPDTNGMSSETVLLDADWGGGRHRLVARLAPEPSAVPVFPDYDLERQARILRDVRALSDVPVPEVLWSEPGDDVVGTPFFVMRRVDGRVPPDVMPYNFDSWVTAATPDERARMQASTVDLLVRLHAIDDSARRFAYVDVDRPGATAMRRQLADQVAYYEWARGDLRSPIIERTLRWLDEHLPDDEGEPVLCWGDSRIGNVIYEGFEPVAALDWEMAAIAPPEVDVVWCPYLHRFFEDLAVQLGAPGLPDFLRLDDYAGAYERSSGRTPRHLRFYTVYAAVRFAIVSVRTTLRRVHFGEMALPDDLDDLVMHREGIEALLAGRGGPGLD